MPKRRRTYSKPSDDERQLRSEIFGLLDKLDATVLARILVSLSATLSEQIEAVELNAVRAAHYGRHDEEARLNEWVKDIQSQQELVMKLQVLVIQHGGRAEALEYFSRWAKPKKGE